MGAGEVAATHQLQTLIGMVRTTTHLQEVVVAGVQEVMPIRIPQAPLVLPTQVAAVAVGYKPQMTHLALLEETVALAS